MIRFLRGQGLIGWPRVRQDRSGKSRIERSRKRALHSEPLERRELLAGDVPLISEFVAVNDTTLLDEFGRTSDWIEIYNPSEAAMSLNGWHLSDDAEDMAKWTFPDVTINAGEFVVVYASGDDRTDPAAPLHTNFRLNSDGEYLALVQPDMTVVQEFSEAFPEQFTDLPFGVAAQSEQLFADDSSFTFFVPTVNDAGLATSGEWTQPEFDDSTWELSDNVSVKGGVGYAIGSSAADFEGQFETSVEGSMFLLNSSLWVRQEFVIDDTTNADGLLLSVQFDDGYVAYLNGNKVAEKHTPAELSWNAVAEVPRRPRRTNADSLVPEVIDLGQHTSSLIDGTNVLAMHLLNEKSFDDDAFLKASLTGITMPTDLEGANVGYLTLATPGTANRQLKGGTVGFSVPSQLFTDPISIELTSSIEGQTIRYTTDRTAPTALSPEYTGPIQIAESTQLWAAAFAPDGSSGPLSSRSFTHLAADALEFSSDLPLVVFDAFGGRRPGGSGFTPEFMTIIEPDGETGRTVLTGESDVTTRAGLKVRGSSTAGNPKLNLSVETWDQADADGDLDGDGDEVSVGILGMPAESDWVFFAPYNFDRTGGARNAFFYEISNQVGPYAPRTRFVEVFHNLDGGDLEANDYTGLYTIIEKIKRGEDRVNIQKLSPDDIEEPNVNGGYIWKIDRADPGDGGVNTGSQNVKFVNPKESDIEAVPEQLDWVRDYFNELDRLTDDPDTTWQQVNDFIDVPQWIDHHIVNVITKNVDALRLSGYFHKDRGGPLVMGPIWDCDRCMGSEDGRDANPRNWSQDTPMFTYPWWDGLFRNQPDFWQAWIDRWHELRQEQLSVGNVRSMIDTFSSQLAESQVRNYERWTAVRPNGGQFDPEGRRNWEGEVAHLKNWLTERLIWMDGQLVTPATISPGGGKFDAGKQITLSAELGEIYYTLDGTDPRALGGEVSSSAVLYDGPFTLSGPATINVRAKIDDAMVNSAARVGRDGNKDGSPWSAPVTANFAEQAVASAATLRITEVNYNPAGATPQELAKLGVEEINNDEFEFVEVTNISDDPINLDGAEFVRVAAYDGREGIRFTFDAQVLAPGERVVVVENVSAFRARFGDDIRIATGMAGDDGDDGEFGGNLQNRGETLRLADKNGDLIQRFAYDDSADWPQRADGGGSSLELVDVNGDLSSPLNWRASSLFGGSPGASGTERDNDIAVTEVLINTDGPEGDMIELHNTTGSPIDITNWFITDDQADLFKFKVTTPTVIPALGYMVLSEQVLGFGFDGARGGAVSLLQADSAGKPIRFAHQSEFGNSALNVSLGRWPDSRGEFFPMATTTLGRANSNIRVGEVVISEIHYSPLDPDGAGRNRDYEFQFIELYNTTDTAVDLSGWQIQGELQGDGGEVTATIADGTTIDPADTVVLVPFDPSADPTKATVFQFSYASPAGTKLAGPFEGPRRVNLADEGGNLKLLRPDTPPADDPGFTPLVWIDEVIYDNEPPWPTDTIQSTNSLSRVSPASFGQSPSSWISGALSPGSVNFVERIVGDSNGDGAFDQKDIVQILQAGKYNTGQAATFGEGDWTGDGVFDQKDIVAALRAGNFGAGAVAALRLGAVDVGAAEPRLSHNDDSATDSVNSPQSDIDLIFAHLGRRTDSAGQRPTSGSQLASNESGRRELRQISLGRTDADESSRSDAPGASDSQHGGLSATLVDRLLRK